MAVKITTYLYCCDDDFSLKEFEPSITESVAYRTNAQQVESLILAGEKLNAFRMAENASFDGDDYIGEDCYHDDLDEINEINARIRERKLAVESEKVETEKNPTTSGENGSEAPAEPQKE